MDCSRILDYNFEIGRDSVSYYSNRFVSVARNAEPNLHTIVRNCNGQQRCKLYVNLEPPLSTPAASNNDPIYGGYYNVTMSSKAIPPGIRVLFSCELIQGKKKINKKK